MITFLQPGQKVEFVGVSRPPIPRSTPAWSFSAMPSRCPTVPTAGTTLSRPLIPATSPARGCPLR
jgi:hypothetical protein